MKSVASPVSASFSPHSSRDSVLSFVPFNRLCKCHLPSPTHPPCFLVLLIMFFFILRIFKNHFLFSSISFVFLLFLSPSLSSSLRASFSCFLSCPYLLPHMSLCGSSCLIWVCRAHSGCTKVGGRDARNAKTVHTISPLLFILCLSPPSISIFTLYGISLCM